MLSGAAKDVMEDTLPAYKPDAELTMMQVHSEMQAQDIRADRKPLNKNVGHVSQLTLVLICSIALQDTWKNGLDIMKLFETSFASPGMKVRKDAKKTRSDEGVAVLRCVVHWARVQGRHAYSYPLHLFLLVICFLFTVQAILDDVETQHKIMENLPLLAAFDGFKEITGRRLDDAGVSRDGRRRACRQKGAKV